MAEETAVPPAEAPALPDFYTDPNAVLGDSLAAWRYGSAPDYSKTRKMYAETKSKNHEPNSLAQLVENLVKNWEVEASFKTKLEDWRTVNQERYTFSMNGGTPQGAENMLKVGTYNAVIAPNEFYSPESSDFASSHKTFKRMMPFFAWEVLEVYSPPPKVALRWRHWGQMKNDYVGFNNRAEKVTAKAHQGWIDIQGLTVADLDENMKIVHLETWFDPLDMFRQIAPLGIVNKQPVNVKTTKSALEKYEAPSVSEEASSLERAVGEPAGPSETTKVCPHHPLKDGATLAEHEPVGPLLPHETGQEDAMDDDGAEFADAYEHMPSADLWTNATAWQSEAGDSTEPIPQLQKQSCDVQSNPPPSGESDIAESNTEQANEQAVQPAIKEAKAEDKHSDTKNPPDTELVDAAVNPERSRLVSCEIEGEGEDARPHMHSLGPHAKDSQMSDAEAGGRHGDACRRVGAVGEGEATMQPEEGEAVAVGGGSGDSVITHEEMSRITAADCPFLNGE